MSPQAVSKPGASFLRQPKPYLKKSHNCYYVNLGGKPVRLDTDKEKAWEKYYTLTSGNRDVTPATLVLELIAIFLARSGENHRLWFTSIVSQPHAARSPVPAE